MAFHHWLHRCFNQRHLSDIVLQSIQSALDCDTTPIGLSFENLEVSLITIQFCIRLFKIHHRSFWVFEAYIQAVANLANMVKVDVLEMHFPKVEI